MSQRTKTQRLLQWAVMAVFLAVALTLIGGGAILIGEGGSVYYVIAGLAVLASAYGLYRRRNLAMFAYGGLLSGTFLWAWWEAGFDGWALAPRLVAPAVLGLVFFLPSMKRASGSASRWWIGVPLLAIITMFAVSIVRESREYGDLPRATPLLTAAADGEWRAWGHDLSGRRYSALSQIDTGNVGKLAVAWQYDSNVEPYGGGGRGFEATPLAIGDKLFVCLDRNVVVALDQENGREIWRFDPKSDLRDVYAATCRGVSYHEAVEAGFCQKKILFGTSDARLMAVDAGTGRTCPGFGKGGAVDLLEGLGPVTKGYVYPTSPPAIVNGVVVIGHWVADGMAAKGPGGVIRGFDAATGELRWAWDSDRPDRTGLPPAGESYSRATANAWGVFSGDEQLGLVYVPTGVGTPDYFGAHRSPQTDKYGSSIVAIDVATGKVRWHFQTTHHDIWDYDVASQPVLVDLDTPKGKVPAMITPTKRAQLFVLDRRTGKPIDKVIEKPVPQGAAPQEWVSKTQPYTTGFPSLAGDDLRERDMWGLTPLDQLWCRIKFKQVRYEGQFTPQGVKPVLTYPGSAGGSNWGSATVDPDRGLLILNTLYAAEIGKLIPRAEHAKMNLAAAALAKEDDKSGVPKMMRSAGKGSQYTFVQPQDGTPYAFERSIFLSPLDALCQKPPYARLHVFDIKSRKLLWSKPFGTIEHTGPFGIQTHLPIRMGVPTIGGSMATGGGLLFIGASQDRHFRAYDVAAGRILWDYKLPTTGAATPMTYRSKKSGRQFVIIAAGGHPALKGPPTGRIYAFALPK